MKKITPTLVGILYACLFSITGCQNNAEVIPDDTLSSPKFTLPVETALEDIRRYSKEMNKYDSLLEGTHAPMMMNFPLKGFTIRSIDLLEALGIPQKDKGEVKYEYVRVYIGLSDQTQFKLFLTPADGANLDTLPAIAGIDHILKQKIKDGNGNTVEQGYVLDFAMPCPNTCPKAELSPN